MGALQTSPLYYPFTALVGQEELKLALLLNVIDPRIGGVMIMGDRGTGKTAIAVDAIINQRHEKGDSRVHCFYVAIGQKESTVARVIDRLEKEGAMEYTTVVVASAPPTAACTVAVPV